MQPDPIATLAADAGDLHASQPTLRDVGRRRAMLLLVVGAMTYVATLIATLPARLLFDPGTHWIVGGTVWHGAAVLDGRYRAEWRWSALSSFTAFAFRVAWHLDGAGTALTGTGSFARHHLLLESVHGTGDGALLAAFAPGLPFRCEAPFVVAMPRLLLTDAVSLLDGEARVAAGTCVPTAGVAAVGIPALSVIARSDRTGGSTIAVSPLRRPGLRVMSGNLRQGRLEITPTEVGTRLIPFLAGVRIAETW